MTSMPALFAMSLPEQRTKRFFVISEKYTALAPTSTSNVAWVRTHQVPSHLHQLRFVQVSRVQEAQRLRDEEDTSSLHLTSLMEIESGRDDGSADHAECTLTKNWV